MKKIIPTILVGLIVSTSLLVLNYISGSIFAFILALTVFVSMIITVDLSKLKEVDLKSLKLVLSDIKDESKHIRALAINLSELIAMNSEFQNRWGTSEWSNLRNKIQRLQIEKVLSLVKDTKSKDRIFKYRRLFEQIDSSKNNGQKNNISEENYQSMITNLLKEHLSELENKKEQKNINP